MGQAYTSSWANITQTAQRERERARGEKGNDLKYTVRKIVNARCSRRVMQWDNVFSKTQLCVLSILIHQNFRTLVAVIGFKSRTIITTWTCLYTDYIRIQSIRCDSIIVCDSFAPQAEIKRYWEKAGQKGRSREFSCTVVNNTQKSARTHTHTHACISTL